jgi:hypothetical protein
LGFVQGAVFGIQFFFFTGCGFLSLAGWGLSLIAAPVGGVLGGIVGGLSVRTIKGNAADATDAKEHERRLSS